MARRRNGASCAVAPLRHLSMPRRGGARVRAAPWASHGAEARRCDMRHLVLEVQRCNGASCAVGSPRRGGATVQLTPRGASGAEARRCSPNTCTT